MDTIFDLRNISYSYAGKIDALKDISLKVNQGGADIHNRLERQRQIDSLGHFERIGISDLRRIICL